MPAIPLPPYAPDVASIDNAALLRATNVFPRSNGYGPVRAPSSISAPLPGPCRGAIAIPSLGTGGTVTFAGTATRLYKLSGGAWVDVTGSETVAVADGFYWSFSVYGDRLIATPTTGKTLYILYDTGSSFAALGGNPPTARFNGVVGEFLVLAGAQSFPNALQWSDVGNIELWTPGSPGQQGDVQILPDGGAVTGFAGGEFGLVFQERTIRRMVYNPGSPTVFDFSVVEENRGCVAPSSLISVGGQQFFLDRDGFYAFQGGGSVPIGAERVNRTFADRVDIAAIGLTVAMRDPTGPRVLFAYRSRDAAALGRAILDEVLVYDYRLDRWAFLSLSVQYGLPAAASGASLDAITGNVDTLTKSFDSADYYGGSAALGLFGADNALSLMVGPTLEAVIESSDMMLARPNRAFSRGFRADTDAPTWAGQVGTRETLSGAEAVRWRPESAPADDRYAPSRASGKYHRHRWRAPAATPWSYVAAIEPDAIAEGMR